MSTAVLPVNRDSLPFLNALDDGAGPQQQTALELLQRCVCAPEEPAWLEFLNRIRPFLASVVTSNLRRWRSANPWLVDDLVQNIYLKLCANDFKALRELECPHEAALFGFLKVVASHTAQDHFRSSCCQKRGSGQVECDLENIRPTREQTHNFGRAVEQKILIRQINECLQSYKEEAHFTRDYRIFWLYYSHGLTAREISEHPKIGVGAKGVESILLRLTRMVRVKMNAAPREAGLRAN